VAPDGECGYKIDMLLVCNGAYKSGSTWLFRILQHMTGFQGVPAAYAAPGWAGNGIHPPLLQRFLSRENYRDENFIIKAHFFEHYHQLLGRRHLKIVNIRRDTRDVVVSAYFYERLKAAGREESAVDYYHRRGRKVARMVVQYNRLWHGVPETYMSSYEALHSDFDGELKRLAAFVGVGIGDDDVQRLRRDTSLESLKAKYDERSADGSRSFFRKGVIGDWREHLTPQIVADIERIEQQGAEYPRPLDLLNLRLRHVYCVLTQS
jgi:hypothetical protein